MLSILNNKLLIHLWKKTNEILVVLATRIFLISENEENPLYIRWRSSYSFSYSAPPTTENYQSTYCSPPYR